MNVLTQKDGKALKAALRDLCAGSDEIRMLVGFFYFSGVKAFYEALTANPQLKLRVLVGADIEYVMDRVVECELTETDSFGTALAYSDNEIRARYVESLRKVANAPESDKASFHDRIGYFIEMLKADRLVIRRTRGENHEKLFLFKTDYLTGSSNLTRPGLTTETDVDVRGREGERAAEVFEELWENSVTLTEEPETKQRILDVFANESMLSAVTPYEAYVLAIKTYLDLQGQVNVSERIEALLEANGYRKYRYQLDAVNQALTILKEYNGVILADVVGLGKSVIASLVAKGTYRRGIIIAPPGLVGDKDKNKGGWCDYMTQFKLDGWEVFSCGKLEDAYDYVRQDRDVDVVVVDEAHRFKNQDTEDYEVLCNICRGRQVVLLTATPFNNRPADIFALLKLFIVPNRSKITLDDRLADRFSSYDHLFRLLGAVQKYHNSRDTQKRTQAERAFAKLWRRFNGDPAAGGDTQIDLAYVKRWSRQLAREIRQILEPVIIRRNRIDLRHDADYREEVAELSNMADPVEQFFELTHEQSAFYDRVMNDYFGEEGRFKGAIYRPFCYEQRPNAEVDLESNRELMQQANLYDFMRRLLVRRFESSFGAFAKSVENFLNVHEKAKTFVVRTGKFILDRKLLEKIYNADDEDIAEALSAYEAMLEDEVLPKNNKIYEVERFARRDEFLADIDSDIELFRELLARIGELSLATDDPKAAALANVLFAVTGGTHASVEVNKGEPIRKVIVFSEFKDTVEHLIRYLSRRFPDKVLSAAGGLSATIEDTIKANFDASYRGVQKDDLVILLATDKMSEGHNLNRAGLVVNYDIPWNPTRVIQRVGRINRIGRRVFKTLYIFNFFPTEAGATIAKSREIASSKMFMIHNTIGEDAKIFDVDETPTESGLYTKILSNPENADEESFLTKIKNEYREIVAMRPKLIDRISHLPFRVKTAKEGASRSLVLFRRKGLALYGLKVEEDGEELPTSALSAEDALTLLKCGFAEPRRELGVQFWKAYSRAGKYQETFMGGGRNTQSLEVRTRNNLLVAIAWCEREHLLELLSFLRTLLEDVRLYGSLPDFTLRRLSSVDLHESPDCINEFLETVIALRDVLGGDYLCKIKRRLRGNSSDIIIAEELVPID